MFFLLFIEISSRGIRFSHLFDLIESYSGAISLIVFSVFRRLRAFIFSIFDFPFPHRLCFNFPSTPFPLHFFFFPLSFPDFLFPYGGHLFSDTLRFSLIIYCLSLSFVYNESRRWT